MAKGYLSIMGMYAYDLTLFAEFNVPTGIAKQDCIDNIVLHCAELELIYPRVDTMKYAIGVWSRKNALIWQKLYDSTQLEYNPIWNKDGKIVEVETRNLSNSNSRSASGNKSGSGSNSSSTDGSSDTTQTQQVSAFDSSSFENREKVVTDINDSADSSGSFSNSENYSDSISDTGTDTGTVINERTETGNIGITTTQQMISEEREIVQFSIVDFITNSFMNEFCLQIY